MRLRIPGFHRVNLDVLREAMKAFRPALEGMRPDLAKALLLTVGLTLFELLRPWPIKFVLDSIILGGRGIEGWSAESQLLVASAAIVLISFGIGTVNLWRAIAVARIGRRVATRIRRDVFRHLHRLSFPFHQSQRSGDLLVRLMGDVNMVRDLVFASWIGVLTQLLMFIGVITLLSTLSWKLALISLVPIPFLLLGMGRSSKKLVDVTRRQRKKEGQAASMAAESLAQIRVVKSYAGEDAMARIFARQARSGERAGAKAAGITARMARHAEVLTGLGLGLVLYFGASAVVNKEISPGLLVVCISYTRALYKPLRGLTKEGARVSRATACAGRLLEILNETPEDGKQGLAVPRFEGEIRFDSVSLTWPDGGRALRGASFEVPAGSLSLIKGPNGSGKSTALSLLLRLLRPDKDAGHILIDGQDIATFALDDYRRRFAYVPQQVQLFGASVRDNLLYGEPEASEEALLKAVDRAHFRDVLDDLPKGLDTVLGERGESLSGGEARKLMLARAALRDARILLLDEPLAGLDPVARAEVAQSIRRVAAGRTTIIVSHEAVDEIAADHVIALDDGVVISEGSSSCPIA